MKIQFAILIALGLTVSSGLAGAVSGEEGKKKKTALEGTWKAVKGNQPVQTMTFTGNKFEVVFEGDRVFKGTFKLLTDDTPKGIDLKIKVTPKADYKGKTALGIYEIKNGTLIWCSNVPGKKRRPPRFAEQIGDAKLLLASFEKKK